MNQQQFSRGGERYVVLILFIFICTFLLFRCTNEPVQAKELPLFIQITDLTNTPKKYNGQRIAVKGFVSDRKIAHGRMGSLFLVYEITTLTQKPFKAHTITAISGTLLSAKIGDDVHVQGTFLINKKHGGYFQPPFIRIEYLGSDQ